MSVDGAHPPDIFMRLGAPRSRRDERAGLARSAHRNRRIRKLGSSGESVGDCLRKNTWGAGTSGPSFPPPRPPTLLPSSCSAAEFARFLRMNERRRSPGQRRPPGGHRRTRAPGACGPGAGSLQIQESLFLLGNTVSTTVSGPNVTHRFVGRGGNYSPIAYASGSEKPRRAETGMKRLRCISSRRRARAAVATGWFPRPCCAMAVNASSAG